MSWKRLEVGGQLGSCCQRVWKSSSPGSAGEMQLSNRGTEEEESFKATEQGGVRESKECRVTLRLPAWVGAGVLPGHRGPTETGSLQVGTHMEEVRRLLQAPECLEERDPWKKGSEV